jgi:DNA-directed RNA polymerase specialized sigma24 family protein
MRRNGAKMHTTKKDPREVLLECLEPTIRGYVGWLIRGWGLSWDLAEAVANKARASIWTHGQTITKNPVGFVKRIFHNAAVDFIRERKTFELETALETASPGMAVDDSIEECKELPWYKALNDSEREISDLLLEGWTRKEIREKYRLSADALRQRFQVIRKKIAPFFQEAA